MAKEPKGHLRRWRIVLARHKGVSIYLGTVDAPDAETAAKIAAEEFDHPAWRLSAEPLE